MFVAGWDYCVLKSSNSRPEQKEQLRCPQGDCRLYSLIFHDTRRIFRYSSGSANASATRKNSPFFAMNAATMSGSNWLPDFSVMNWQTSAWV